MAVTFSVPSSPKKSIFQMNYFQGCDFTNSPANVDETKSPNCINMVRDVPGKIRKSMGYKTVMEYPDRVNGSHYLRSVDEQLIHAGEKIYHDNVILYDEMNDHRSKGWQFDDKLYIQDGKEWLVHECTEADIDEGQTVGYHEKNVVNVSYTESTKSKEEDVIYFKFPYLIKKIEVNNSVVTESTEGLDHYDWTCPSDGDYNFKFTALEVFEPVDGHGTFTLTLGENSEVVFPDKEYQTLTVSWLEDGEEHTENITSPWTNTHDANEFTFNFIYWVETEYENNSGVVPYTPYPGSKFSTLNGDNFAFLMQPMWTSGHGYSNLIGKGVPEISTNSFSGKYMFASSPYTGEVTPDSNTFTIDVLNDFNFTENDRFKIVSNGDINVSCDITVKDFPEGPEIPLYMFFSTMVYPNYCLLDTNVISAFRNKIITKFEMTVTITPLRACSNPLIDPDSLQYAYGKNDDVCFKCNLCVPNGKELTADYFDADKLEGTLKYAVNRDIVNGFIDNTDGEYIDEHGLYRTVKRVSEDAYIPTITIAKDPRGGGEQYYAVNLLQPGFIELFQSGYVTQSGSTTTVTYPKTFQLSFGDLDATPVKAWLLDSNGDWVEKTEGTHFTVNRTTGLVTFATAPGASPITGEDSVKIQAYRTVEGYADRVNKTTISILFGVNGNGDRIFASGNPDYINYDWYSEKDDPSYWPDTGYSTLGSPSSAIVGYSIISNYLAAHKDDLERDANIILREGNLVDNEPAFPIVASLQGAGAIAPWSFAYLETEPMFLTKRGIYAVTAQDITGEKYSQNRSYYLDGKLLDETNLDSAYACVYNDFYILALNNQFYILDGLQPMRTDKSMPYATRQYAGFYRTNVPAHCVWTFEDELYFGTEDGKVCKFYTDKTDLYSYNDDGEAIECVWESPDLDGKYFFKNKTFRYLAVRLDSAIATSINIYTMKRGIWNLAKTDNTKARYFDFNFLNFLKFSFSTDTTQKIIHTKLRVKKVDKARFRFTNTEVNEPFGIFDVALEYIENGNYKG